MPRLPASDADPGDQDAGGGPHETVSAVSDVWVHTITIAAREPAALAAFWLHLLGYEVVPNHTASVQIADPSGRGPTLLFAPSTSTGFGRDRFHLDLRPRDQVAAVDRAIALGATRLTAPGEASWVRLADPEGNRFCLLQSQGDADAFVRQHGPGTRSIQA